MTTQFLHSNRKTGGAFSSVRRRGVAIVEAAFIVPMLLVITLLLIQYGIILNTRLSLYHVSRNAGRYAAMNARAVAVNGVPVDTAIRNRTIETARGYGIPLSAANITFSPAQPNTTFDMDNRVKYSQMTMTINFDMRTRLFLPSNFLGIQVFGDPSPAIVNTMMIE